MCVGQANCWLISPTATTATHYEAVVISATDYYAFGQEMPGRTFTVDGYRFGFNGKENEKDWGTQLIQDYGFRLYNPAIGRFLSVDPLTSSYPWNSTYAFAENNPIKFIDLDGLERSEPPLNPEIPNIVKSHSSFVYEAIQNAQNCGFRTIEKFAQGEKTNENTLKGVVGEAVFAYNFIQRLDLPDIKKAPNGFGLYFSNDHVSIEFGSNREEDLAIIFDHTYLGYDPGKDELYSTPLTMIGINDVDGSSKVLTVWGDKSVSLELKAWDVNAVKANHSGYLDQLENGIEQVKRNVKALNRNYGILVIDKVAYEELYKHNPVKVSRLLQNFIDDGFYLRLEKNYHNDARSRLYSLKDYINNYYKFKTP